MLNDSRPDIGTICQVTPTNETAIFLKTLRLQDSPQLEQRLLKGLSRTLGKRAVKDLHAGVATSTGQPLQIIWAFLWIPKNHIADPGDISAESFASGRHRLWPKSLLSPYDTKNSNKHTNGSSPPITLEIAENYVGAKKAIALYNESMKIQEAIELYNNQQAARVQEEAKLNNDTARYSDTANQDKLDPPIVDGGSEDYLHVLKSEGVVPVNDVIEDEDEEDLFASSPSPALAEDSTMLQDPASGQENPIAIDSVEQASASMFTPTHHHDPQYAPSKYDVSPTDPDGRTKVYQNGLEAMITDDDFNFFDVNAEISMDMSPQQQIPYEEYGDLSTTDFGDNFNQPHSQPVSDREGERNVHWNEASSNIDAANTIASGSRMNDVTDVAMPEATDEPMSIASPRSDDDLWNEDDKPAELVSLGCEVVPEHTCETNNAISCPRLAPFHFRETSDPASIEAPLTCTVDNPAVFTPHIDRSTNATSTSDSPHKRDPVDYSQPLEWSLVQSAEQMVPVGFDEVSFQSPDNQSKRQMFQVDSVCLADKYGDGRVLYRTQLLRLLREEEFSRRQRAHGRLPFHLERMDLDNDALSAASTVSDRDDLFADSADDASEATAVSSTRDEPSETQGVFTLGQYPFSSDNHLLSTGFSVTLEENDSMTLRKRVIESNDSGKQFETSYPYIEDETFVDNHGNVACPWAFTCTSSNQPEYIGE